MKLQYKILIALAALAISFGIGYYATPTKIQETVKVEYKDSKVEVKTRIVYRDKVTKPDGTIIESEVEKEDTNTVEKSEGSVATEKVSVKDSGLVLGVLGIVDTDKPVDGIKYGITVSKRVLGAVTVHGLVTTDKQIGVGVGWEF
jgi:hypothetical protein